MVRWRKGDRVRMTRRGRRWFVVPPPVLTGTVVGFRDPVMPRDFEMLLIVRRDDRETAVWPMAFWEHIPA